MKPLEQKIMAKWIVILGAVFGLSTYLLGARQFAKGLILGIGLYAINYWLIDALLGYMFSLNFKAAGKLLGFLGYQVRFVILVVILYFVITRNSSMFAVGFFVAMLLAKLVMGFLIISNTGEEWWLKRAEDDKNAKH